MERYKNLDADIIHNLLSRYGLTINCVEVDREIPYSFWGSPEAGRLTDQLFVREDTPIHSVLHESCHYVCMPASQRSMLSHDAKGTVMEENATCYLQILLADHIFNYSQNRLLQDMDDWGYSFRLGSARAWFTQDAKDVEEWLISHEILNEQSEITWKLRI